MTSGLGHVLPTAAQQPPSLGIHNQEFNVPAPVLAAMQQEYLRPTDPRLAARAAKTHPCQNFRGAAWLLSKSLKHAGGDLWKAVGWYQFGKDPRGLRKDMAYRYTKHIQPLNAQRGASRDAARMGLRPLAHLPQTPSLAGKA